MLGVGLIGCGGMGRVYAQCLASLKQCRLISVYDNIPDRCEDFAREFSARIGLDAGDVINDPKVDCVFICTTHDSHLPLVREVAKAGKPVYCEKPMGLDLVQAIEINSLVKQKGLLFMIGFNHRRNLGNLKAKELVERNFHPYIINVIFACPHFLEGWMGLPEQGGGILNSLGCHAFDLSCHFIGDVPVEVSAVASRLRIPQGYLEDTAAVAVRFRQGAIAFLSLHDHAPDDYVWEPGLGLLRVEVFGPGKVVVSTGSKDVIYSLGHGYERLEFGSYSYQISWGYQRAVEDFIRAVQQGTSIAPNEDDGLLAAYLVDAAQKSARTGQLIRVELPEQLITKVGG